MPDETSRIEYSRALEDFRRARAKARLQHLWAAVTGESLGLLRYDEITTKMHTLGQSSKGLKNIPVNAIVGSVNRYQDFDRNFLPLRDDDGERWAKVKAVMTSPGSMGLPPIRVYKIGDAYFVLDGNHRVSIARQMEIDVIEAYVTEIQTRVPISPDDSPEEIILKAEYSDFLEETKIDKIIPEVELKLTFPGQYPILVEHIRVHRHYLGLEHQREIPWEEAVLHWYHHVYQPIVEIIREQNFLIEFPEKTETDLYIWVLDHQSYMEEKLGWPIRPDKAASDLLSVHGKRFVGFLRHIQKILTSIFRKNRTDDPYPSKDWHYKRSEDPKSLFTDILVPLSGKPESWLALEQAIIIADLEKADVRGLSIRRPLKWGNPPMTDEELHKAFAKRLEMSGLQGNLVFEQGKIAETICARANVNDLISIKMSHPPSKNFFARLKSGTRKILRRSTRPLLFVRDQVSPMNNLLLAYDGSPKGKEALYIAAYLASRYKKQLSVIVVDNDEDRGRRLLSEADVYLGECCLEKIFRQRSGRISIDILQVAEEINADMIIMGGYGLSPLLEIIFGSTVDGVLRGTRVPVIVSQ
jgi:nucleotide-binding universal stress UspA family protein